MPSGIAIDRSIPYAPYWTYIQKNKKLNNIAGGYINARQIYGQINAVFIIVSSY